MKKLLLLGTVACALGAQAAEVDITPSNYHFNTAAKLPKATTLPTDWTAGANPPAGVWSSHNLASQWDNGLLFLHGDKAMNAEQFQAISDNFALVDFGGTVGKCLTFASTGCVVNDKLKELTGYDYNIPVMADAYNWMGFSLYLDPNNTPTVESGILHAKITYNVFAANSDQTAVNKVYVSTDQNGVRPDGNAANSAGWPALGCWTEDPETEELAYDPTKWKVFEFDFDAPAAAEDGTVYLPVRIKFELPGSGGKHCFMIKDITVTHLEGVSGPREGFGPADRVVSDVTYTMGQPSEASVGNVAADDQAVVVDVNGDVATFSADAQVYTVAGVKAASAKAAQGVSLAPGLYVAVAGNQAVKFAVK